MKRNFKWLSMRRGQCPIYNSTLKLKPSCVYSLNSAQQNFHLILQAGIKTFTHISVLDEHTKVLRIPRVPLSSLNGGSLEITFSIPLSVFFLTFKKLCANVIVAQIFFYRCYTIKFQIKCFWRNIFLLCTVDGTSGMKMDKRSWKMKV